MISLATSLSDRGRSKSKFQWSIRALVNLSELNIIPLPSDKLQPLLSLFMKHSSHGPALLGLAALSARNGLIPVELIPDVMNLFITSSTITNVANASNLRANALTGVAYLCRDEGLFIYGALKVSLDELIHLLIDIISKDHYERARSWAVFALANICHYQFAQISSRVM